VRTVCTGCWLFEPPCGALLLSVTRLNHDGCAALAAGRGKSSCVAPARGAMISGAMSGFATHLVRMGSSGASIAEPVAWKGRVSEQDLEDLIVANPQLAGEELLVLGRQLTEFLEDDKRLDVLAVDRDGEIVLLELKVDADFGVTDLQALAYAAAYANKTGARTLRPRLSGGYIATAHQRRLLTMPRRPSRRLWVLTFSMTGSRVNTSGSSSSRPSFLGEYLQPSSGLETSTA
jgi:hypothetical protein